MKIGVVSDTHNNLKNVAEIINLFNHKKVDLVIHTGDITNAKTLSSFSSLKCDLYGVFGNNDRDENGLEEIMKIHEFKFQDPPLNITLNGRNIAVFHEPDPIDEYRKKNLNIDIILHGHTHRYREEIIGKVLIYNPGESAGMQKGKNAIGVIDLSDLSTERIFF
mgnify:CR=1 FL=1